MPIFSQTISKLTRLVSCTLPCVVLVVSCAHKASVDHVSPAQPASQAASRLEPKVKAARRLTPRETASTESAMTNAAFDRAATAPLNLGTEILRIFWPLLTMLGTGLVLIAGLLIEHLVLNHLFARRAIIKAREPTNDA